MWQDVIMCNKYKLNDLSKEVLQQRYEPSTFKTVNVGGDEEGQCDKLEHTLKRINYPLIKKNQRFQ